MFRSLPKINAKFSIFNNASISKTYYSFFHLCICNQLRKFHSDICYLKMFTLFTCSVSPSGLLVNVTNEQCMCTCVIHVANIQSYGHPQITSSWLMCKEDAVEWRAKIQTECWQRQTHNTFWNPKLLSINSVCKYEWIKINNPVCVFVRLGIEL